MGEYNFAAHLVVFNFAKARIHRNNNHCWMQDWGFSSIFVLNFANAPNL